MTKKKADAIEQEVEPEVERREDVEAEGDEKKSRPTTISFPATADEAAFIRETMVLMGFGSQRECCLFLMGQGVLAMRAGANCALNSERFATALWSIGKFGLSAAAQIMDGESSPNVRKILKEYDEWAEEQKERGKKRIQRLRQRRHIAGRGPQ